MGICYRYTRDYSIAEDLMQDSFIKVLTRIKTFRWKEQGSFTAWIRKIAVNTCLNYLEKNRKLRKVEVDEDKIWQSGYEYESVENILLSNDESEMESINQAEFSKEEMFEALSQVPEPFRIVFNLYAIEGYKHQEISDLMHINIKTSKTRLFRARKILKKILYTMSIEKTQMS